MPKSGERFSTIARLSRPRLTQPPQRADFASYNVDTPLGHHSVPVELRSIRSLGIDVLAKPRIVRPRFVRRPSAEEELQLTLRVPRAALLYRATDRIRLLAKPRAPVITTAELPPTTGA